MTRFSSFYGIYENGQGLPGDSGGPVTFTLDNQIYLADINKSASTILSADGITLYTDFTPEIQGRIREEYGFRVSAVPEPSSIAMLGTGVAIAAVGAYVSKKRNESGPDQV
jgi:hypothetical protein